MKVEELPLNTFTLAPPPPNKVLMPITTNVITIPCIAIEETLIKNAEETGLNVQRTRKAKKRRKCRGSYATDSCFYTFSLREKKISLKKTKASDYIDFLLINCYRKKADKVNRSKKSGMFEVEYIVNMKIFEAC